MKMYQTEGDARLELRLDRVAMGYPIGWTSLEESQESQPNNKQSKQTEDVGECNCSSTCLSHWTSNKGGHKEWLV